MAARFDAATDRLVSTTALPAAAGPFTVTAWVYLETDRNTYSTIWALTPAAGADDGVYITTWSDGTTLRVYDQNGSGNTAAGTMPVGAWYRTALVVNGTSMTLYGGVPGVALTTSTVARTVGAAPTLLHIGNHPEFATDFLDGRIADVKMWDAALTPTEIATEFSQRSPVRTANLNRYYPLTSDLQDYSGNGYHLTAGSTAVAWVPGPALITRVQYGQATSAAQSTAALVAVTNAASAKNLLLAHVAVDREAKFTVPSGWTALANVSGRSLSTLVVGKLAAGTEKQAYVTWTFPASENTFEGGTNGTAITTGNSGGASGDSFASAEAEANATVAYSTAQAMHGTRSALCTLSSAGTANRVMVGWGMDFSTTRWAVRGYFRWAALPTGGHHQVMVVDGNGGAFQLWVEPDGSLRVDDSAGLGPFPGPRSWTSTTKIAVNTWYRFEAVVASGTTTSNGSIDFAAYTGDSATPIAGLTYTRTDCNTSTSALGGCFFGNRFAEGNVASTFYIDSVARRSGATAFIGPHAPGSGLGGYASTLAEYTGVHPDDPFGPITAPAYDDTARTSLSLDPGTAERAGLALAFLGNDTTDNGTEFQPTSTGWTLDSTAWAAGGTPGSALLLRSVAAGENLPASTFTWTRSDQTYGAVVLVNQVNPPVSTLTDNFATADDAKWSGFDANTQVSGGQLVQQVTSSYNAGLLSQNAYSLVGSSVDVQLVQRPNIGNGSTEAYFGLDVAGGGGSANSLRWFITGSDLYAERTVAGTRTNVVVLPYSPTTHQRLRIRESGGTIFWDTHDGATWTERGSWVLSGFSVASMTPVFIAGYWDTEPSPGTVIWDNFNIPTLDKLKLGAALVGLRVGSGVASKAYLGTTQVWP